ncbi:hypothetical protein QR98_0025450, partial [Sarcoptes scabiei]
MIKWGEKNSNIEFFFTEMTSFNIETIREEFRNVKGK